MWIKEFNYFNVLGTSTLFSEKIDHVGNYGKSNFTIITKVKTVKQSIITLKFYYGFKF